MKQNRLQNSPQRAHSRMSDSQYIMSPEHICPLKPAAKDRKNHMTVAFITLLTTVLLSTYSLWCVSNLESQLNVKSALIIGNQLKLGALSQRVRQLENLATRGRQHLAKQQQLARARRKGGWKKGTVAPSWV